MRAWPSLVTCSISTQTRLAPTARSIAPPICRPVSVGECAQFARSPFAATWKPPSTQRSRCPPRTMAKLSAWWKKLPPGRRVTRCELALISQGFSLCGSGAAAMPRMPFSECTTTSRSAGMWSATSVGMPMPRLTYHPSGMSRASRAAMPVRPSRLVPNVLEPCAASFIALLPSARQLRIAGRDMQHAIDEDAGGDDLVRRQLADIADMVRLHHGERAGHGHDRVEVAAGVAEDQVAPAVGHPGLDQRDVAWQGFLEDAGAAVVGAHLLALGDQRAGAGGGEEGRHAGAGGADALGQRALRHHL